MQPGAGGGDLTDADQAVRAARRAFDDGRWAPGVAFGPEGMDSCLMTKSVFLPAELAVS